MACTTSAGSLSLTVPAQPGWAEEHIRRLSAAGIQSAFQCYNINSFESVERLMRRGIYKGPLVMNWVAIGGGISAGAGSSGVAERNLHRITIGLALLWATIIILLGLIQRVS